MSFVIDCSVTIAWVYDNERTEEIDRVLDLIHSMGAVVPAIWPSEVANTLQQGVKQRRIDRKDRAQALANLGKMKIDIDRHTNEFAWNDTLAMADRFGLTTYDASYLELAHRTEFPLATLDQDLRAAAAKLGVVLL
jgi:predicted nucleic acid-binding protein